eukprot:m.25440 g.25440  ORF g.25440 m.25440 type:complete len:407 (-) comp8860_c0_seq2:210-1430(-)
MWKASAGHRVEAEDTGADDDWETDPDFVNDVSEKAQRWGSKSVEGTGRVGTVKIEDLRKDVVQDDQKIKQESKRENFAYGYGGKFGVQSDRKDKAAFGADEFTEKSVHSSQVDGKKGFGGSFGVDERSRDKNALGFDAAGRTEQHSSTTDYKKGFGGAHGVAPTDKHAHSTDEPIAPVGTAYEKPKITAGNAGAAKSRFEKLAQENEERSRREAEERKAARAAEDQRRQEEERKRDEAKLEEERKARPAAPAPAPAPVPAAVFPAAETVDLSSLTVTVDTVRPTEHAPITAYDKNNLRVLLHICRAQSVPANVVILLASFANAGALPISRVNFQAAVPKTLQIKLLPPSGTELPPFNPVQAPTALTQLMLLGNPSKAPLRLRFKLSFVVSGQEISDQGDVSTFPTL